MKILDLVDTSNVATAHLRDVGELIVQPLAGVVPMMRACVMEDNNGSTVSFAPTTYVSYPDSGGIKIRRSVNCRGTANSFFSGVGYLLNYLEKGLIDKTTQLNLTYTQSYLALPTSYITQNQDITIVLQDQNGNYTYVRLTSWMAGWTGVTLGMRIKRELIIDRKRRSISWVAKNPANGQINRSSWSYASYSTSKFAGVIIGLAARQDAPASAGFIYTYSYDVLLEDILFTENDLPTDPPRHGNFELATLFDVVNSSHPNAAALNAVRKVPKIVADRYTASTPVSITAETPVALTLRPTMLSDAAAQGKGKCVAVMVTADLKSVAGSHVCKGTTQGGRSAVFRTPRTHPFQQPQGMPGIGATVAQIDVRLPNGDIDASSLTKTITLSVN